MWSSISCAHPLSRVIHFGQAKRTMVCFVLANIFSKSLCFILRKNISHGLWLWLVGPCVVFRCYVNTWCVGIMRNDWDLALRYRNYRQIARSNCALCLSQFMYAKLCEYSVGLALLQNPRLFSSCSGVRLLYIYIVRYCSFWTNCITLNEPPQKPIMILVWCDLVFGWCTAKYITHLGNTGTVEKERYIGMYIVLTIDRVRVTRNQLWRANRLFKMQLLIDKYTKVYTCLRMVYVRWTELYTRDTGNVCKCFVILVQKDVMA